MEKRRVAVTGMGMITPLGKNIKTTWENLIQGRSGISKIKWESENTKITLPKICGKIDSELIQLKKLEGKMLKKIDRFTELALIATLEATAQAQLEVRDGLIDNAAVIIGSSFGGASTWEHQFARFISGERISPYTIPCYFSNMAAANIAIFLGCNGSNECCSAACASGAAAIGNAFRKIKNCECDIAIAGGSEAALTPFVVAGFHATKALSSNPNPDEASRPFDCKRDGFIISEGACVLVIEEMKHAIQRKAKILAEITGFGTSCDAHNLVEPQINGIMSSMKKALGDSGLPEGFVCLVNAHATSTPKGDVNEVKALNQIFQETVRQPFITANKSQLGHTLGAAGAIEAALSVMSILKDTVPPILNLEELDPECNEGGLYFAESVPINAEITTVLSNSSGFGGTNATLIFEKYKE